MLDYGILNLLVVFLSLSTFQASRVRDDHFQPILKELWMIGQSKTYVFV